MTLLIAQITDTHIVGSNHPEELYVDNNARLALAVERILAETVQPEAVIFTGDVTDTGSAEQMEIVTELLSSLPMPVLPVPGNHDKRSNFRRFFDRMPWASDTNLSWRVDVGPVSVVGLDTLVPDQIPGEPIDHGGLFDDERAVWLDETLAATSARPTAIAMHHPPFTTGISWMDETGLRNMDRFAAVVGKHPHVTRVFCGHIHRPTSTIVGGALTTVGISTVHQIQLELQPNFPPQLICDPPGYQLHHFDGKNWVSHVRFFDTGAEPINPSWA